MTQLEDVNRMGIVYYHKCERGDKVFIMLGTQSTPQRHSEPARLMPQGQQCSQVGTPMSTGYYEYRPGLVCRLKELDSVATGLWLRFSLPPTTCAR
jgi:hypothetical protein